MSTGATTDPVAARDSRLAHPTLGGMDPVTVRDPVSFRRFSAEDLDRIAESEGIADRGVLELRDGLLFRRDDGGAFRFTVEQYYRLAEIGVLRREERVELIEGVIYSMSPIGSRHSGSLESFVDLLKAALQGRAQVRTQNPIQLPDGSEPEPDVAVVRPRRDYYRGNHPTPADVLLVVEFMDSSTAYDRGVKLTAYALAGIPEVWLADLRRRRFEVHRKPADGLYTESFVRSKGQTVSPEAFPDVVLNVAETLS